MNCGIMSEENSKEKVEYLLLVMIMFVYHSTVRKDFLTVDENKGECSLFPWVYCPHIYFIIEKSYEEVHPTQGPALKAIQWLFNVQKNIFNLVLFYLLAQSRNYCRFYESEIIYKIFDSEMSTLQIKYL